LLTVGNDVAVGLHVTIFTHDSTTKIQTGYTVVGPVVIGDRAYIGAFSIVMPGVTIGEDAIILCGSVVRDDVPARTVAAGSPARVIGSVEDFIRENKLRMAEIPPYEEIWVLEGIGGAVPPGLMDRMRADLAGGKLGFIP
jgi:maltose O-acetyltransferase